MDQNEPYEAQAGMDDSSERLEKKEQLRAKVQALVSSYEAEKRRNEELTMELERLKAEQQQMQGITGPIGPLAGPAPGMSGPMPSPNAMNGMSPPPPGGAAPGGIPFSQRPQQQQNAFPPQPFPGAPTPPTPPSAPPPPPGMLGGMPGGMPGMSPAPEFPPQAPGGYTLQSFGAQQQGPQGFAPQQQQPQPPRPQPPQNPWGAPQPWQQPAQPPQPFGQFPQSGPGAQQPFGPQQFGPQAPQGFGAMPGFPPQAPLPNAAAYSQNDGLSESVGLVLQTITQVRAKLHQSESIRGYGYPQQPAYVDYDTVALLDKLYDQLGDLSRELMQRQGR